MAYLYETHLHTAQGSACGKIPGGEHIAHYKALGYAGVFITDHFFGGNCAPDRSLPWETWVHQFCAGYEEAKAAGDQQGVQVFFGLEQRFDWDEWLVYGLDKRFLLSHPEMIVWTRGEWLRAVHAAGGCCVQAHPFRARDYMTAISPCLGTDGAEICNAGNDPLYDAFAARYAARNGLYPTAGSDLHRVGQFPDAGLMGVCFDAPLQSALDYAAAVRGHRPHTLKMPPNRLPGGKMDASVLGKPFYIYDQAGALNENLRPGDIL